MLGYLSKIIRFDEVLALGIFRTDEKDIYYTLNVKKKGNNLDIQSFSSYKDAETLLKSIDRKKPVILLSDGKGVLNKKIDPNNENDVTWKRNLDLNSIYYTEYKTTKNVFMSFCRKQPIDDLIAECQKNGLEILDFYLGPLLSAFFKTVIPEEIILSGETFLQFEEEALIDIYKNKDAAERQYTFGSHQLNQYYLALYGAVLHFFINQKEVSKTISSSINKEEIIYKKSFNVLLVGTLVTFLVALLASYLLIQHYSGKNAELNEQNVFSQQTYQQIQSLQEQKEQKMKILEATGQLSNNFLSYYVYELAKSVPSTISINETNVFPVAKEIKANEKVMPDSNTIIINGSTVSEYSFNQWINQLREMKWIKKFEIVYLKKDKKNIEQFEIKILLNGI
jgi:Tfp pilus assembly protein PilN